LDENSLFNHKKSSLYDTEKKSIGFFEKYLSIWVALGIIAGIIIGQFFGESIEIISKWEIANVNIPVAILIWADDLSDDAAN
jgi:arsenite transporter